VLTTLGALLVFCGLFGFVAFAFGSVDRRLRPLAEIAIVGVLAVAGRWTSRRELAAGGPLTWLAGALAFPLAGLCGTAVAGRVDDAAAALVGGTVSGLVLGAGQALVSRRRLDPRRWIPATGAGMGAGLVLGAWTVGYGTPWPTSR
jgi:hypothetical protein